MKFTISASVFSLLIAPSAFAENSKSCSAVYPGAFSVTDGGQIEMNKGFKHSGFSKSEKEIKFGSLTGPGVTIQRDEQGRAVSVVVSPTLTSVGAEALQATTNFVVPTKFELEYRGGRCFVDKVTARDELYASSEMCHELAALYNQSKDCTQGCSSGFSGKVKQIVEKHGGNAKGAEHMQKTLGVAFPAPMVQQSYGYLTNCDRSKPIAEALADKKLWENAPANSATGRKDNTAN